VKALVNSFLESDSARPLDLEVFNWMLTNGTASWLIDGLDEVIAQDPGFFEYLLDQLRLLFGKLVRPNGQARRSWIDRKAALAGRRIHKPEIVLNCAVRYGYLSENAVRQRVERPDGQLDAEFVSYVSDLRLTDGLRSLLAEACDIEGCAHVPTARQAALQH
jgi:hypothetical protein